MCHHKECSSKKTAKGYTFLVWDGFRFFGFAFDKLPRLRGKKPSFKDKLSNRKLIVSILIIAIVSIWVMVEEVSQVGKVKK